MCACLTYWEKRGGGGYYYLMHAHSFAGAIKGSLLDEYDIAQFLLAVVNSREGYRSWENLNQAGDTSSSGNANTSRSHSKKRQYVSDHSQVSVSKSLELNAL
jgi:mitochondrial GTPase 1